MIMASNNLISGQVDSGSMAYVLSTSTKRRTVVFTQAGYLIGSVVADGKINKAEYLLIYPALVSCFGDDFDFASIKESFRRQKDKRKMNDQYTEKAVELLRLLDDGLKQDVIMLCLCVTSIDRKITLKEKRYIRRLCDAL